MILGVSSWVGGKFGLSAGITRIIFIILALAGGSGVLIYLICWLLMKLT